MTALFGSSRQTTPGPVNRTPLDLSNARGATEFSRGWQCNRWFRQTESGCVTLIVPANARPLHLDGTSWKF